MLRLEQLSVRDVRNLARVDVEPAERVNVIAGHNGHGKTSILEAIYFAATSKSFRTSAPEELVRHGASACMVRARFAEHALGIEPIAREQVATVTGRRCAVRLDGNRPASLAAFATRSPVVAFHPDELALSSGPAQGRRTLLDRIALFVDPASADHRGRYVRALRARQQLLRRSSERPADEPARPDVAAFEELCAVHGAALTRARERAAAALAGELVSAFTEIAAPGLGLVARYRPGGSARPDEARERLVEERRRDAFRATAGFGPHRDDLVLLLDGHPARVVASQGQHRALTLALKAAEAACVARVRGVEPILLLDDVSSELDPERTSALFEFLSERRGQIFLTTTRPELIVTRGIEPPERADFHVQNGLLARA